MSAASVPNVLSPTSQNRVSQGKGMICRLAALTVCWGLCSIACALDMNAERQFDIPPQNLTTALVEFSRQAGVAVVSATKEVNRFESPGVRGRLSVKAALRALLSGTNLNVRTTESGAIAVGIFGAEVTGAAADGERSILVAQGNALAE